jgi:hypothetical protein
MRLAVGIRRHVARALTIALAVGLLLGALGGLISNAPLLYVGSVVLGAALVTLFVVAIWKNPRRAVEAEANAEAIAAGYPEEQPRPIEEQRRGEQAYGVGLVPSNSTPHTGARER